MTKLSLGGIDPGIKDTGAVALRIDTAAREWSIRHKVWSDVTSRAAANSRVILIDPTFESELAEFFAIEESWGPNFVGVEGYRQRGNNVRQDQDMLHMVQSIHKMIPGSTIVDNTGIRNVVTQDLLKLFQMRRFPATNHADLVSASRVALKVGISVPVLNEVLYNFVLDNAEGEPWSLVST